MSNNKNENNNKNKNNNKEKTIVISTLPEYEIFYSEYGYIKILKEEIKNENLKILNFNSLNYYQSERNFFKGSINKKI